MAELPPIDMEIACPAPRFRDDPEPGLPVAHGAAAPRDHHGTHDYYSYSWGYTVFRTAYAATGCSDADFAKAIERLAAYVRAYSRTGSACPRVAEHELRSRANIWTWEEHILIIRAPR